MATAALINGFLGRVSGGSVNVLKDLHLHTKDK
jgi:hypothetical protein